MLIFYYVTWWLLFLENGFEYPYYNYQNDLEGYAPPDQGAVQPDQDFLSYLANYHQTTQTRQDLTQIEPLLVSSTAASTFFNSSLKMHNNM